MSEDNFEACGTKVSDQTNLSAATYFSWATQKQEEQPSLSFKFARCLLIIELVSLTIAFLALVFIDKQIRLRSDCRHPIKGKQRNLILYYDQQK